MFVWFLLATSCISTSLAVACVVVCSRLASRCTRALTRRSPGDATLARLAADQAELSSSVESLATTIKRVTSRHAMQERRSGQAASKGPPPGASKAQLRLHYGTQQAGFAARVAGMAHGHDNQE